MKLSIIIVNYNVKYFLQQCLASVQKAIQGIDAEVWVVDNASKDGSVEWLQSYGHQLKLVLNTENTGFSRANNQAIAQAKGQYILLLNPDTVVAEDTFARCIAFMDSHPGAGALGVHMVDGKGVFLPESKRGLPTPAVAFYKTFGIAGIFPKSKTFGRYHLGYLPEKETNEVEILSGAFMFMRKEALDKTGLLDETFFMYGEDIDLSYRIIKAGYKNYYFADTTIIHYKGESTKKGSVNYVKVFYNAMIIFAKKHYGSSQSGLFSLLINMAIVFRGLLTLVGGMFASSYLFIVDALLGFAGIFAIKTYWEYMIKYSTNYYPQQFLFIVVPVYLCIWIAGTYLSGGYDRPYRISRILRGVLFGTIAIAAVYAFLPDGWRFSRAIIILGAAWMGFEMLLTRMLYHAIKYQSLAVEGNDEVRTLVVGIDAEALRAVNILHNMHASTEICTTGSLQSTAKAIAIHNCNEVVFCAANFKYQDIIGQIIACGTRTDYKILNPGSDALIGSNSKNTAGDLYVAEKSYRFFKPENARRKRLLDIAFCLWLLCLLPINLLIVKNAGSFLSNWWQVITAKKTWIGFKTATNLKQFNRAKPGVLSPADAMPQFLFAENEQVELELNYARHYSVSNDINLLVRNYRKLGL